MTRSAMVTGATGYVGSQVVEELLNRGWNVTVLVRNRAKLPHDWAKRVTVVEGDGADKAALSRAMEGSQVAWFLIHSMGESKDFTAIELKIAHAFAEAARDAGIERIVYLGGLHPAGEELSEHLASRVAVGEVLLRSGVPTAALLAGVLLGKGSASFELLRTLTERLPGAFGPKWLHNRIQPIDARDAVHYLVAAADLDPAVNRTFDIAGPDRLSYAEMMQRYAKVMRLGPRPIFTLPVMTTGLAAQWIGMVSSMPATMAAPLIGSLLHDTLASEHDIDALVESPQGGCKGFDEAVRDAAADSKPWRFAKILGATSAAVATTAFFAGKAIDPGSVWFKTEKKPSWQPPSWLFGPVWTILYADIAIMTSLHLADKVEAGHRNTARRDAIALAGNLLLNASWSYTYFRYHRRTAATVVAALLAMSSADLVKRVGTRRQRGVLLAPYAAWTTFAAVLTNNLRSHNRSR